MNPTPQPDSPEDLKQMIMEILGLEEDLIGQVVLKNYEDIQSNWKFTLDKLLTSLSEYYTNKFLEIVDELSHSSDNGKPDLCIDRAELRTAIKKLGDNNADQ